MSHVVVAPDKFKGSLTAIEVAARLAAGLRRAVPSLAVVEFPVADGGDGTLDAALSAGFERVAVDASGPVGDPVRTAYARREDVAVVELADVSGLGRLPGGQLRALQASSYGTGEVVKAALDAGCRTVVIGLGGSACTDGGAGLAQALGVRLLDAQGTELGRGGAALRDLARVDVTQLHPAVREATFIVASDVDNPLLGPLGAAAVFAPQKGASPADVAVLEAGLARWSEVIERDLAVCVADKPGAGAAGGVGYAAMALLGAELRPGIEHLLELLGFDARLAGAQLVITGEGSLDRQTLHGKAPVGVAAAAGRVGVPTIAVAGRVIIEPDALAAAGIRQAYALTDLEPDVERCIREAGPLLERLAHTHATDWLELR